MKKTFFLLFSFILLSSVNAMAQFPSLDGLYEMEIQIGDRLFRDEMLLQGANRPITIGVFSGVLKGHIAVPDVFTSPLEGYGSCSMWGGFCHFNFDITAHENGQDFTVHYAAKIEGDMYNKVMSGEVPPQMVGVATLENGETLGTFNAVMKK